MDREQIMAAALAEAERAASEGEVPVGCVIVRDGEIIASAHNRCEADHDPTAHAEILAIQKACEKLGGWRLEECEIYVNLEPCPMCAGAIMNSRISTVVYGLRDERMGACGGVINLFAENFGRRVKLYGGVCRDESAELLKTFFTEKR